MNVLAKNSITLGSGIIYITSWTDGSTIPADATIETEANRLGGTKGGAHIVYEPTILKETDDSTDFQKTALVDQAVTLKAELNAWDLERVDKLMQNSTFTSTASKNTLDVGPIQGASEKVYLVRFVQQEGKLRFTMVGTCTSGYDLAFAPDGSAKLPVELAGRMFTTGTGDSAAKHYFLIEESIA